MLLLAVGAAGEGRQVGSRARHLPTLPLCTGPPAPQATHVTRSGRAIQLRVWAAAEEIAARRADFALASLQHAMRCVGASPGDSRPLPLLGCTAAAMRHAALAAALGAPLHPPQHQI